MAGTVGKANPFRYRGYYYDNESGLYYLNSRYYDPQTGRFVNADGNCGAAGNIQSHNMFEYGFNNPVNTVDYSGKFAITLPIIVVIIFTAVVASLAVYTVVSQPAVQQGMAQGIDSLGRAISNTVNNIKQNISQKTKSKAQSKTIAKKRSNRIQKIYRYGGKNPGNLTPKQKDATTGLSFSTLPPPPGVPAVVTTVEALNMTGKLVAFQDGLNHVSVRPSPSMGTLKDWINTGSSHPCTQAVKSVVVKWDGSF